MFIDWPLFRRLMLAAVLAGSVLLQAADLSQNGYSGLEIAVAVTVSASLLLPPSLSLARRAYWTTALLSLVMSPLALVLAVAGGLLAVPALLLLFVVAVLAAVHRTYRHRSSATSDVLSKRS